MGSAKKQGGTRHLRFEKQSLKKGSNLSIHNDVENTYWDNLRCTYYTDNIVCAEAWGEGYEFFVKKAVLRTME